MQGLHAGQVEDIQHAPGAESRASFAMLHAQSLQGQVTGNSMPQTRRRQCVAASVVASSPDVDITALFQCTVLPTVREVFSYPPALKLRHVDHMKSGSNYLVVCHEHCLGAKVEAGVIFSSDPLTNHTVALTDPN